MVEDSFVGAYGSNGCFAKRIGIVFRPAILAHTARILPCLSTLVGMPFMLAPRMYRIWLTDRVLNFETLTSIPMFLRSSV